MTAGDDPFREAELLAASSSDRRTVALPVFGGSGLRPGVDLEDKERLAESLDTEPGAPA